MEQLGEVVLLAVCLGGSALDVGASWPDFLHEVKAFPTFGEVDGVGQLVRAAQNGRHARQHGFGPGLVIHVDGV